MTTAPPAPQPTLCLGITGHRAGHPALEDVGPAVDAMLDDLFGRIAGHVAEETDRMGAAGRIRLHSLMDTGVDQWAAAAGLRRGWELVASLPFGRELNLAVNALPGTVRDAELLLAGAEASDPDVAARAMLIREWTGKARLFELAESDDDIARQFLAHLADPGSLQQAQAFLASRSQRAMLAGRIMIEQSDFLIAIWDGETRNNAGGTGHTVAAALDQATPVLCIDPADPEGWRILTAPEALAVPTAGLEDRERQLAELVRTGLGPADAESLRRGARALASEAWHARSSRLWTGYRRIEALFGGDGRPFRSLVQTYEAPEDIGGGSRAPLLAAARALTADDPDFAKRIEASALRRFAWADGISARISDAYRGGMIANFMLSVLAVAAGMAYQPLGLDEDKWLFALVEFLLLCSILGITWLGVRRRWHKRWFETRRVAEYLRHAPILALLGVTRPAGRWPKGTDTSWPEYYARQSLRECGLPQVRLTGAYLRRALGDLLGAHAEEQHAYHLAKARRLTAVHHGLDRLSTRLFTLAVISVSIWLLIKAAAAGGLAPQHWPHDVSKIFTFLGVIFPTLGAGIAGMRYFGDFERFAAISEVTAEKLEQVKLRAALLRQAPDQRLDYASVAELAHAIDRIVIDEIESWQAVFGGKHITVPV